MHPKTTKMKKRKRKLTIKLRCLSRTKSTTRSTTDAIAALNRTYTDFCNETSLHGLKHTVSKEFHWLERLLWFALTVLAFCGALYCALNQFNRFYSEPVVVSLQRDYRRWWTTFPAITACFIDRVQPDKAKGVIMQYWNVTEEEDAEKYQYYYSFIELVAEVSFRTNLQNFWKYQADNTVKGIDLQQLALSVHPQYPLEVLRSGFTTDVPWVPVMTEVGLCSTYNSHYAEYQFATQGAYWKPEELMKCHYHSGQCFLKVDSKTNPVRFFIHSPFDISTAISNPTGEVAPGEELVMDYKAVEIQAAASVKTLRPEQRRCRYPDEWLSDSIRSAVTASPSRAKKLTTRICRGQSSSVKKHSPSEALSLFIECDLTKRQYEILYESNKNVYPCYSLIKEAKKECYPKEESMRVTETCAEVQLQDLLNHTASRLCKYLEDVFQTCVSEELLNMELITKWGCDGSQQSKFQKTFKNDSEADDSNIFQSSLVPIRLQTTIGDKNKILWQNPTTSSPRFCRPIRIRFVHETVDITKYEIKYVEDQVKELTKTPITNTNGTVMFVSHTLALTMVDAKVCNATTGTTSTMRCYICGKTSKSFNNLNITKDDSENPEALRFGISVLHARIRLFETLLHIAYKLPFKKWQARGQCEKNIVKQTKESIQKDFRTKTGLIIDMPKAGFGNSNSGNTSRRFFSDPEIAAEITGRHTPYSETENNFRSYFFWI